MAQRKKGDHTPVESIKHADKRANIPTEELRDFVAEEERSPKYLVYPRDTSLDPQLVWKGKDEQDSEDLKVPAVPIYVQEKIHPQALIENLRETAKAGEAEPELTLFDDYDGIEFEELIDFYHHEQNWSNRMILGDSLLVMTSLAEKEALKGKVQMIYMDPPYGIKFGSNWQVSTRRREVKDGKADDTTRQPEQVKAFRDTWEFGVHSYLAYLRDRLTVSRDLLSETGSIFIQIGEENVHLVRSVLDEVFGSESFVSMISFVTTSGFEVNELARAGDYLLWYAKNREVVKVRTLLYEATDRQGYRWLVLGDGTMRGMTAREQRGLDPLPAGARVYKPDNIQSQGAASEPQPFTYEGKTYLPGANSHWKARWPEGMERLAISGRIHVARNSIQYVRFIDDFGYKPYTNLWTDTGTGNFTDPKLFVVQTNTKVVARCMLMTTDPGDLVLDPTCGSGTTAVVAEEWGRRWITIDTSRVALALARTRLMSSRFPYYLLADSQEGAKKITEVTGEQTMKSSYGDDVRKGFVCRRVPHVTLKSIASNEEIREGMTRDQIEAAVARRAESEVLLDQPYLDESRVRVSGPFTVESLSPHRVLYGEENEFSAREGADYNDFTTMILENLKKAGVQNTRREQRLRFTRVEPYAGEWINAVGEAAESGKRVGISVGPEHGTVGAEQVKEAAKEAIRGVGFDLLIVLGFAFDGGATETASEINPADGNSGDFAVEGSRQYGKLRVLLCRMNPDL
ncbi:MAG: site-specific DNA-methyltransferase, partial [Coriobacteriia bacterium]|nr:site-specific DNA-methyltransferase [Coriobacteriia bacterium]